MALSIKDERADALAREIASITHQSLTKVVTTALEARLGEVKKNKEAEVARKRALIDRIQRRVKKAYGNSPIPSSKELMDALYDERGLPK